MKWFQSKNMWNVKVQNILFLCCSCFPTLAFTAHLGLSASADGLCGKRAGWVSLVVRQHLKIARAEYLCSVMEPYLESAVISPSTMWTVSFSVSSFSYSIWCNKTTAYSIVETWLKYFVPPSNDVQKLWRCLSGLVIYK